MYLQYAIKKLKPSLSIEVIPWPHEIVCVLFKSPQEVCQLGLDVGEVVPARQDQVDDVEAAVLPVLGSGHVTNHAKSLSINLLRCLGYHSCKYE